MNKTVFEGLMRVQTKLRAGEPVSVGWLFMGSPITAEIMARSGFDLLILDLEHSPGADESMYHQLRACDAQGVPVVVRLPEVTSATVARTLDAGAAGIAISDMTEGRAADELGRFSTYATAGERGTHRVARGAGYGMDWDHYKDEVVPNLLLIGLIESQAGIDALQDIAGTPRLDAIFIGGVDLAAAFGRLTEPGHPDVQNALRHIEKIVSENGKALGGLATSLEDAKAKIAAGYTLISYGSDLIYLRDRALEKVAELKPLL